VPYQRLQARGLSPHRRGPLQSWFRWHQDAEKLGFHPGISSHEQSVVASVGPTAPLTRNSVMKLHSSFGDVSPVHQKNCACSPFPSSVELRPTVSCAQGALNVVPSTLCQRVTQCLPSGWNRQVWVYSLQRIHQLFLFQKSLMDFAAVAKSLSGKAFHWQEFN
jgi:hypothetical protein